MAGLSGGSATVSGQATVSVTGNLAGAVTLLANVTLGGPGPTTSNTLAFSVTYGAAAQILLTGATTNLSAGSPRQFTATIKDAAGNTVTGGSDATDTLTFGQSGGTGSVTGLTSVVASGGIATDTVTGGIAGPASIQASGTLSGVATTSAAVAFTVIVGSASHLAFTQQPIGFVSGSNIGSTGIGTIKVAIEDAGGNVVTTASATIALSKASGPSGGTLGSCSTSGNLRGGSHLQFVHAPKERQGDLHAHRGDISDCRCFCVGDERSVQRKYGRDEAGVSGSTAEWGYGRRRLGDTADRRDRGHQWDRYGRYEHGRTGDHDWDRNCGRGAVLRSRAGSELRRRVVHRLQHRPRGKQLHPQGNRREVLPSQQARRSASLPAPPRSLASLPRRVTPPVELHLRRSRR